MPPAVLALPRYSHGRCSNAVRPTACDIRLARAAPTGDATLFAAATKPNPNVAQQTSRCTLTAIRHANMPRVVFVAVIREPEQTTVMLQHTPVRYSHTEIALGAGTSFLQHEQRERQHNAA
jgi:hypothetical protein